MSSFLRLLSILCSLVLIASFAMFASDQAGAGSKRTVAEISAGDNSSAPAGTPRQSAPKKKHGAVRTAIDDANAKLVSPFDGMVAASSPWTKHIAEGVLAFLVFGLGLGFVARYAATRGV
jgi:hypothetical protein